MGALTGLGAERPGEVFRRRFQPRGKGTQLRLAISADDIGAA